MKTTFNTFKSLALIFSIIFFISCDEVEELTEVDFKTTLSEEVPITLTEDSPTIGGTLSINLNENTDIAPYLDKLEAIQITNAYYTIKNYVGVEDASGSLSASAAGQNFGPFEHTFTTDAENATQFQLDSSKLVALASNLRNNGSLNIAFVGQQVPAQNGSFDIEITLELDVTAQAL